MSITQSRKIIQSKMNDYENLLRVTQKHPGYMGKLTELLFAGIDVDDLHTLYNDLVGLSKMNVPIDIYKKGYGYESICDDIISNHKNILVNMIKRELPKILRDSYNSLSDFSRSSANNLFLELAYRDDRKVFITKISRFSKIGDVSDAIRIFLKDGITKREDIIKKVKLLKDSHIVSEGDNHLVVQIGVHSDMVELGSDTSWCITSSLSNWRSYTYKRVQYILYDFNREVFDPMSKIGITTDLMGQWYTSHDKLDKYVSKSDMFKICDSFNFKLVNLRKIKEVKILPLGKLTNKTAYIKYDEFANFCDLSEGIMFCKKILSFDRWDQRRIHLSISILIKRMFPKGLISIKEIDALIGEPIGESLIELGGNLIYSCDGAHINSFTIDYLKSIIGRININHISIISLHKYIYGYQKISIDKLRLLYDHLNGDRTTFVYTSDHDLAHCNKLHSILSLYFDIGTIEEKKSKCDLLTYKEGIMFIDILPSDYLILQKDDSGVTKVPRISIINVKKMDYSSIFLNGYNIKIILEFLEYNKEYNMSVKVSRDLFHGNQVDRMDETLCEMLIELINNKLEQNKSIIYKGVYYSLYEEINI